MYEIEPNIVQQREGDYRLRWFSDADHDLYAWTDDSGRLMRFHFCYDKSSMREQVVRWQLGSSLDHALVDGGNRSYMKPTPIFVRNGLWDLRDPLNRLRESRDGIDPLIYSQIIKVFEGYTLQVSI